MWEELILISGGIFIVVMIWTGISQRRIGCSVKGRVPINRPLFFVGKGAMVIQWGVILWRAAAALWEPAASHAWTDGIGALLFAIGCGIALAGFPALGRETRIGLPEDDCSLKTNGIYACCRNPMYVGIYLMALGSCLYVFNVFNGLCLLLTVVVHHRIVLAEERFMAERFGEAWRQYISRTPRYFAFQRLMEAARSK